MPPPPPAAAQGETWSVGGGGERYNRWWGENHQGDGFVQRFGNSSTGGGAGVGGGRLGGRVLVSVTPGARAGDAWVAGWVGTRAADARRGAAPHHPPADPWGPPPRALPPSRTPGEHWDHTEQMDTYYNPIPHFGYDLALAHSPIVSWSGEQRKRGGRGGGGSEAPGAALAAAGAARSLATLRPLAEPRPLQLRGVPMLPRDRDLESSGLNSVV